VPELDVTLTPTLSAALSIGLSTANAIEVVVAMVPVADATPTVERISPPATSITTVPAVIILVSVFIYRSFR
jgi:hypothetical protein